jgi:membrane-associated phospholipid phosphatase
MISTHGALSLSREPGQAILIDGRISFLCSGETVSDFVWLDDEPELGIDCSSGQDSISRPTVSMLPGFPATDQLLLALGVMAVPVTLVLVETDQHTYNSLYSWKQNRRAVKTVSPIITQLGDGRVSMGLFAAFLSYGYLANDETATRAGIIGLESFALSGLTTQLLKHLFSRERPSVASRSGGKFQRPFSYFRQGRHQRRGFAHYDAFPSGHTATAFAAATTLADVYRRPWVTYTAFTMATAVALSRITEGTHWASDCFVGALLGVSGTKLVEYFNDQSRSLSILPVSSGNETGITLSVRF